MVLDHSLPLLFLGNAGSVSEKTLRGDLVGVKVQFGFDFTIEIPDFDEPHPAVSVFEEGSHHASLLPDIVAVPHVNDLSRADFLEPAIVLVGLSHFPILLLQLLLVSVLLVLLLVEFLEVPCDYLIEDDVVASLVFPHHF